MARAPRLLALVQLLRRYRTPVTAEALAQELGVSVRSVYRDVAALREQGASIEGEAGVGYVLQPGFVLPPLMFRDDELEALVLGLRLAAEVGDAALAAAAEDVLAKVRAVLPRDLQRDVDATGLLVGPHPPRPTLGVDLAAVRLAVREERRVSIRYADEAGRLSERVIWPYGLAFFERVRLVCAWCELRADHRSFRLDRVSGWTTLPDRYPRPRRTLMREWREREPGR